MEKWTWKSQDEKREKSINDDIFLGPVLYWN